MEKEIGTVDDITPASAPPGDRTGAGELRTCHNYWCDYETREPATRCARCGRPVYTAATFRRLGVVLAAAGGVLAVGAAVLLFLVAPRLAGVRGGAWGRVLIVGVIGLVGAMGLAFASAGVGQALSGRRSRRWMTVALVLVCVFLLIASVIRAFA